MDVIRTRLQQERCYRNYSYSCSVGVCGLDTHAMPYWVVSWNFVQSSLLPIAHHILRVQIQVVFVLQSLVPPSKARTRVRQPGT